MDYMEAERHERCPVCPKEQTHVHEVLGNVIPVGTRDHVHEVKFRTDFYEDHFHEFSGRTQGAIPVGNGRHVHFLDSVTEQNEGHRHKFRVATLIDDPIGE